MTPLARSNAAWGDPHRPPFEIFSCREAGVRLIAVSGELDIATSPQLQSHLDAAAADEGAVLADLSAVGFIDSTAVRSLWEGHNSITSQGRRFAIACTRGSAPRDIMNLTGLHALVEHYDDRISAIDALLAAP